MPIGAAVAIGSSVVGGIAQNAAAKKNAKAAQNIANQNQAAINNTQSDNNALFAPFVERGNTAGDALNQFLGLPTSTPNPVANATAGTWDDYLKANPDVMQEYNNTSKNNLANNYGITTPEQFAEWHYTNHGKQEGRSLGGTAAPATGAPATNGKTAFDNYLNSTDYQFTANAGRDTINSSKATSGLLKSGSALKALEKFSAGNAQQYTQNYINNLANQQAVGANAASGNASSNANVLGANTTNNNSVLPAQVAANTTTANVLSNIANQAASAYGATRGASSYGSGSVPNNTEDWVKRAGQEGWS